MDRVARSGTLSEVGLYHLGVAILSEHLKMAALALACATTPHYVCHDKHRYYEEIRDSVAFVMGSGLETVIEEFNLPVNPDRLRDSFLEWAEAKRQLLSSP